MKTARLERGAEMSETLTRQHLAEAVYAQVGLSRNESSQMWPEEAISATMPTVRRIISRTMSISVRMT